MENFFWTTRNGKRYDNLRSLMDSDDGSNSMMWSEGDDGDLYVRIDRINKPVGNTAKMWVTKIEWVDHFEFEPVGHKFPVWANLDDDSCMLFLTEDGMALGTFEAA